MATHAAFDVETDDGTEVRDVTDRVREAVPADADGVCTVFVRHTTAGVAVNEAESRLLTDVEAFLDDVVPESGWKHDRIDDNADAHLRALLVGESASIPVVDGELQLGTWQSVLFVECDGPRRRSVSVVVD
jgi:secondary thiamine-phosphate synthase enzyme